MCLGMSKCVYTMTEHVYVSQHAPSIAPLHLLGHSDQNERKHDSLYMLCYWYLSWHHMVPMALKMKFYSLGQDNWNEVQLGHDMPLALVSLSHDADGIINGTITVLTSMWLKWGAAWLLVMFCLWHWHKQHVMLVIFSITPLHWLGQGGWNEVQHNFFGHVMPFALMLASHDGISIVKETTTFFTSRPLKLGATWIFWSCNTIAIAFGITWCLWFWCHMMPFASVSVSHDVYSIINGTIIIFRSRW